MKVAVLADIHGNKTALEAVINDAKKRGINDYILLGDLFAKGPSPYEVYEEIEKLHILYSIRGNTDTWFLQNELNKRQKLLTEFGKKRLPKESFDYIRRMPIYVEALLKNYRIGLIHQQQDLRDKKGQDLIIVAHTHVGINNNKKNSIVNPGSVGAPYDGCNLASYGILEVGKKLDFYTVRIEYNIEKEKKLAQNKELPYLGNYIKNIEEGRRI